jgi:hypothetical protein
MITQEAREAAADLAQKVYGRRIADCIRSGEIQKHHFLDASAAAEQRGREQAAVIAERYQHEAGGSESYKTACSHIAAAIRNAKDA